MIRALQVSMGEEFGGIEKLELEILKHIDTSVKFDFLTPNDIPFKNFENEIRDLNGNLYNFNLSRNNIKGKFMYMLRLYKFLRKNSYDVIHINSSAFFYSFQVAVIAKLCGSRKIVVHSHNTLHLSKLKKMLIAIMNPMYRNLADAYLSCSKKAENSLFTDKFIEKGNIIVLKNGIDIEKFKFNVKMREKYRKIFNLDNKVVYGNVARLVNQKNHEFLIDIFNEIQKKQKNSVLLIIGDGPLRKKMEEKVEKLNISDKVIFLGYSDDVSNLLNCMDFFVFPSLYEGLGISIIEAQTNGLITYCSKEVPSDAKISPYFKYFSLDENAKDIANKICSEDYNLIDRKKAYKYTIDNEYDINKTCEKLIEVYND